MFSKLKERFTYFFFEVEEDWQIGIAKQSVDEFIETGSNSVISWLPKSRNVFQADPFCIQVNDKYYLFYEEYDKQKKYGYIRCRVYSKALQIIADEVIIDEGIHFSFPLVIPYKGQYYMLPETIAKGRLVMYKAVDDTLLNWEEYKTILNKPCMDSIMFLHNGSWWLFYSKADINGNNVFYIRNAPDMFADWGQCEEVAIQAGSRNARSAGNVVVNKGEVYRLAQNCARIYGESVVVNQINNLSLHNYSETEVGEIKLPPPYNIAFHTISGCGNITLVDGKRRVLYAKTPGALFKSILAKVSG